MSAATAAVWSAAGLLAYTYVGFPALVLARGLVLRRPVRRGDATPAVSVIIAAHNEERAIEAKLKNLLALDYPPERLEIVIASDGSTDETNDIVARYAERSAAPSLRLLALPRVGKASALTAAVEASSGEVLVFSDANSMLEQKALRALVAPLADPSVGGVAGNQVYARGGPDTQAGERTYWSFDRVLKEAESSAGNVISATGALYAVRRELFSPVRPDVTDDFFTSTGVIEQGKRLVFARDAVAVEPVAASGGVEFGRKVRIMTRGLRAVVARRRLLNPARHGFYALELFSHKVLRRMMVAPLAALLAGSAAAWGAGWPYRAAAIAQAACYGLGVVGLTVRAEPVRRCKAIALPAYFCLVNAASAWALWNLLRGNRIERWVPAREPAPAAGEEPR